MASLSCINSGLQLLRALKVSYAVVPRDAAVGQEQSYATVGFPANRCDPVVASPWQIEFAASAWTTVNAACVEC